MKSKPPKSFIITEESSASTLYAALGILKSPEKKQFIATYNPRIMRARISGIPTGGRIYLAVTMNNVMPADR